MSRVKLVVPAWLGLPAASVAVAETLMEPSPKVAKSAEVSCTACAEPVPVTVLVTVLAPLVKVTVVVTPDSALTVTTPEAWVASVAVAPLATPVPCAKVGAAGAVVSTVTFKAGLAALSLPAASVKVYVSACAPSANAVVGVKVPVVASYVAATLTPSTYNDAVLAPAGKAPMLMLGVVSSVVAAVLLALCTAPTLSA